MKRILSSALSLVLLLFASNSCAQTPKRSVSVLGDSYSTYQGYVDPDSNEMWYFDPWIDNRTDVSDVNQTWWWQFINDNGFRLEKNNSYSGATICYTGYGGDDYTARSFITRASNLGSPDIILVFGGTNDSWAGSPVGEYKYSEWTKQDLYSFRPAMCYLANYLKNRYPNVEVYFLINNDLSVEVTEGIKEVSRHYDMKFIQLENIGKTTGHPNIQGMKQIAEQVAKVVCKK